MGLNLAAFNPFSSKYHALDDFRTLNFGSQAQIIGLTFFSVLLTVGIGTVSCFRLLVNRFKPKNKEEADSSIKNANSIGVNTLGGKHIQSTSIDKEINKSASINTTISQSTPLETKVDEKKDEIAFTDQNIDNLTSIDKKKKLDKKKKSTSIAQEIAINPSFTDKSATVKKIEDAPISTPALNSNPPLDPNSLTFSGDTIYLSSLLNSNNFKIKHNQTVIHIEIISETGKDDLEIKKDNQKIEEKIKELEKKGKEVILVILKNEVYAKENDKDNLKKIFPNRSFVYANFEDQIHIDPGMGDVSYSIINQKKLIENIQHIMDSDGSAKTIQIDLSSIKESPSIPVGKKLAIEDKKFAIDANQALTKIAISYSYDPANAPLFESILNNKSLKSSRFPLILHLEACNTRMDVDFIAKKIKTLEEQNQKVILVILQNRDSHAEITLAHFKNYFFNKYVVLAFFQTRYDYETNKHISQILKLEELMKDIQKEIDSF